MKTQSIASFAALLSVAVALNVSAFAGPDPQLLNFPRHTSDEKSAVTIALAGHRKAPAAVKPAAKAEPTVISVPGLHGGNRIVRR